MNDGDARDEAHARLADPKRPDADTVKPIDLLGQVRRAGVAAGPARPARARRSPTPSAAAALAGARGVRRPEGRRTSCWPPSRSSPAACGKQALVQSCSSRPACGARRSCSRSTPRSSIPKVDSRSTSSGRVLDFKDEEIDRARREALRQARPGDRRREAGPHRVARTSSSGQRARRRRAAARSCSPSTAPPATQLLGEGGKVGPDLTTADRKNRGYLLAQIVDPSRVHPPGVRRPQRRPRWTTASSPASSTDPTASRVTLVNVVDEQAGARRSSRRRTSTRCCPSAVSLMPEKLLDTLSDQEIARPVRVPARRDAADATAAEDRRPPARRSAPAAEEAQGAARSPGRSSTSRTTRWPRSRSTWRRTTRSSACGPSARRTRTRRPGLEALDKCDVAVFFTRRLKIDGEQLERGQEVRRRRGKPIVGIRTASHGFQNWLEMDKEVFGGDYKGHFGARASRRGEADRRRRRTTRS